MVGKMKRPADKGSEVPRFDETATLGAPELAFPTTLAGTWPSSHGPVGRVAISRPTGSHVQTAATYPSTLRRKDLQQLHALDSVLALGCKLCRSAWLSIPSRSDVSRSHPFRCRAGSQERVGLAVRFVGWSADIVNRWISDPSDLKTAFSRSRS